jgi:signal transduction histidine kinase
LLLAAGLFGASAAHAEPLAATVTNETTSRSLDGYLSFLEDRQSAFSIEDVARHGAFEAATPRRPGLVSGGTLWYRFTAVRAAGAAADWVLAFGEPDMDDVRVYVMKPDGGFTETLLGRRFAATQLEVAARLHAASLSLPEEIPTTVYIRLSSLHKIRFESAALWRPTALAYAEARQSALHGINIGVMAVFIVTNILVGLWLRDASMLMYAVFVMTALCREATHSGIVTVILPDSAGSLNYLLSAIGLFGNIAAFMIMWDLMFNFRTVFPSVHRLYRWGGLLMLAPIFLAMDDSFSRLAPFAQVIMLAVGIGSIGLAVTLVRRHPGDVLLRFYLCAFLPIALASGVEVGALLFPAIPFDLGRRIDAIATTIHLSILFLALGYRFVMTRRQQAQADAALVLEKMARERQRMFVDMATHEFKTPLAVIDSAAQLLELLLPAAPPEVTRRFGVIRQAVRRLLGLIETCLNGERGEAMELNLGPVSPAAIVAQAVARDRETGRGEVTAEMSALPAICLADGALLGIALDALIDNAHRYGPADQPVEIAAQTRGDWIIFTVQDRGPGVHPDEAELIFSKYYRSPLSGSSAGFGIGLHLVKSIATMHGGTAAYGPRDGGGASFVLSIPAKTST